MPYTPVATDATRPADNDDVSVAAAEMRTIKAYLQSLTSSTKLQYCGPDTGIVNAVLLVAPIVVTAWQAGQLYTWKAAITNTGAATAKVSSLGTIPVLRNGVALVGGEIVAGNYYAILVLEGAASADLVAINTTIPSVACLQYQLGNNVAGASTPNNAFGAVVLNTIQYDGIGLTLVANQFTLPQGTYRIEGWAVHNPAGVAATSKLNIYNATGAVHIIQGISQAATGTGYNGTVITRVDGVVTVAAGQALQLQEFTNAIYSRGVANSGQVEVYAGVTITRLF
jgi:acylphosphatase